MVQKHVGQEDDAKVGRNAMTSYFSHKGDWTRAISGCQCWVFTKALCMFLSHFCKSNWSRNFWIELVLCYKGMWSWICQLMRTKLARDRLNCLQNLWTRSSWLSAYWVIEIPQTLGWVHGNQIHNISQTDLDVCKEFQISVYENFTFLTGSNSSSG